MSYLFDTNILIYYFNGSLSSGIKNIITKIMQKDFNVSVISKMEFLGFNRFTAAEKQKAKKFLSFANILPLENGIVEQVIQIKQAKKIKLPVCGHSTRLR